MNLPGALANLLDQARAEAKRRGHTRTEPLHLCLALARDQPTRFAEKFGPAAEEVVRARLAMVAPSSDAREDARETTAILETSARADDPVAALVDAIAAAVAIEEDEGQAPKPEPPTAQADSTVAPASIRDGNEADLNLPSRIRRLVDVISPDESIVGRDAVVSRLVELLARRRPAAACLVGPPGSGRTAVLGALAARLSAKGYSGPLSGRRIVRVKPEAVIAADRSAAFRRILDDVRDDVILALDDVEVLGALGGMNADVDMLGLIHTTMVDARRRVLLVLAPASMARLQIHNSALANALVSVEVPPLDEASLTEVSDAAAAELAEYHGVTIAPGVVELARGPAPANVGHSHPGLLIERLDAACVRAALREERSVVPSDVLLGTTHEAQEPIEHGAFLHHLSKAVLGQDLALDRVAARLAMTRARLDLRPDRPDGVFLFVGPTGVGKTALARALADQLFGDESALIRLDMSEFAQEWALARLIGPQPGYVGYSEPDGWLTTKVRAMPRSVILLDEIEKAHPEVWNAFLQVFDAGRLTDARGNVANFAETVVVMTSNLGADAFRSTPVGFGRSADAAAEQESRAVDAVRQTMSAELVNRLDDIIVFRPLDQKTITRIAAKEVAQATARLAARGYSLTIGEEVLGVVAATGYDANYGARHLERNIERLLLQSLAHHKPGELTAAHCNGAIVWQSTASV